MYIDQVFEIIYFLNKPQYICIVSLKIFETFII